MKQNQRGGKRAGSGRKPKFGIRLGKPTTIRLPGSDFASLRQISANVSSAIHLLIERTIKNDNQS